MRGLRFFLALLLGPSIAANLYGILAFALTLGAEEFTFFAPLFGSSVGAGAAAWIIIFAWAGQAAYFVYALFVYYPIYKSRLSSWYQYVAYGLLPVVAAVLVFLLLFVSRNASPAVATEQIFAFTLFSILLSTAFWLICEPNYRLLVKQPVQILKVIAQRKLETISMASIVVCLGLALSFEYPGIEVTATVTDLKPVPPCTSRFLSDLARADCEERNMAIASDNPITRKKIFHPYSRNMNCAEGRRVLLRNTSTLAEKLSTTAIDELFYSEIECLD